MCDINQEILKQLVDFPEPFKHAIKKSEAPKTTTIHCVLRIFIRLKQHCSENSADKQDIANLHRIVGKLLDEKFQIHDYHVMGAFLDPRQTKILCVVMIKKLGEYKDGNLWESSIE